MVQFLGHILRTALPDLTVEILDQIAEDDKVVTRKRIRGTHSGAFMGIAPTGRKVAIDVIDIIRVEDGRVQGTLGNQHACVGSRGTQIRRLRKAEGGNGFQHGDCLDWHDLTEDDVPVLERRGSRTLADVEQRAGEHILRDKSNTRLTVENLMESEWRGQAGFEIPA